MPGLPLGCLNAQTIFPIYLFRLFILLDHPMNLGETRWKKNYSNANYSGRYTSPSMFIRLRALYFDVNKQFFQPGLLPDPFNPSIYY